MAERKITPHGSPGRRTGLGRLLLPLFEGMDAAAFLPLAQALRDGRRLSVIGVVPAKQGKSLSHAAGRAQALRTQLRQAARSCGLRISPRTLVSYDPAPELALLARKRNIDLMLLPWPSDNRKLRSHIRRAWELSPCPVALAVRPRPSLGSRLLLALRSGPDSVLAMRIGLALARTANAELLSLRAASDPADDLGSEQDRALAQVLEHLPDVEDRLITAVDPAGSLVDRAAKFNLTIAAARDLQGAESPWLDSYATRLLEADQLSALIVGAAPAGDVPAASAAGVQAISVLVDKWFAENTFHASEFENLQSLLERKQSQGTSISLALPALNEEKTIAKVILTIRRALMEEVPLLDEMVLIDSDSSDRTRQIAADLGIPTFIHQKILPRYGARQGKGEALWKSLYVTQGDIVLWMDTDIVNIHPRFVYGLIGPLLLRPELMFVKGFYLRPIKIGDTIQAGGGGRVTELTARPLLNLFYPALSGLIQPLSGEYGGRRQALEQLPFSSGYGVEIGLLIDILEKFGLAALGQVDLIERIHHNQPLATLSKMSFAIIQTVLRKIDRRHGMQLLQDINRSMKVIRRKHSRFFLELEEIAELERPPMASLPEYRTRLKGDAA
jgi:hypothetical protein